MAIEPGHRDLVDALAASGVLRSERIRQALLQVDRGTFVPDEAASAAYRDAPIVLRVGADGRPLSAISQPTMVALMLEQLSAQEGHRVLEVGTASGYDAALLCHLVGDGGLVVTVEIDGGLSALAAERLRGAPNVRLVVGDGRDGYIALAPYDRIIVTAGAIEVAPAWVDQLVTGGLLVVPITGRDRMGWCITFEKVGSELVERASMPCGFVPLRSADA